VDFLEWATNPWGQSVPIHIAWFLIWVAVIGGLLFLMVHATWLRFFAKRREFASSPAPTNPARLPARVPRHSLVARVFHWIMAAAMLTLLFTAFLPKVGVQFDWVTYHWIAGIVLTLSILFHIVHASFFLDFWSIWPDRTDIEDANRRVRRFFGMSGAPPRKFAKYPLENKLFHGVVMLCGLAVICTGIFMLFRVRTGFLPRNPYLFGDMTWGMMYVLHGLAGVGVIALVMMHVYFGLRPEKRPITKSMIFGWMDRSFVLEEHDLNRWRVAPAPPSGLNREAGAD
jgi:cytochrome b subunit of formate dehydrogenase